MSNTELSKYQEALEAPAPFEYYINLDERGEFYADVRREDDTVFEIHGFDIFEDGIMKHKNDLEGLAQHLRDIDVMGANDKLIKAN